MKFASSSPAEQGVNPEGIVRFLDAIEEGAGIEPHSLIVQRHGRRIVEGHWRPHDGTRPRLLYSLSKTFTGTALALQIGEGRLGLDDFVRDYLPARFDTANAGLRDLRIRHIASMATGHNRETLQEAYARDADDVVRGFLQIAPDAEPGTLFAYNQPPVVTLATILQQLTGERLVDYLRPRLFDPLGIGEVRAQQIRPGFDFGFTGVYTNVDAIARLGQLYLDDGLWEGRRILPEGWVQEASSLQVANTQNIEPDWRQGYGLQVWRSRHGYRGDGAFGQYMVVLPKQDAVIALLSCTENMQRVLDLMWTHLLPAMTDDVVAAGQADEALAERLANLTLPTAQERLGGRAAAFSVAFSAAFSKGLLRRAPGMKSHATIDSIELGGDHMVIHEGDQALRIPLLPDWSTAADGAIASSAARLPDGTTVVDLVLLDTPHRLEITLRPEAGEFDAHWPLMPLFGGGIGKQIALMHAPA